MQGAVARNMEASLAVPTFHVGYTVTTDALDALYKKVRGARGEPIARDSVISCIHWCPCLL